MAWGRFRRALCAFGLAAVCAASLLFAQPRENPMPKPIEALTPETAAAVILEFRATRFAGAFCLRFELEHRPRRGDGVRYEGYLWGAPFREGSAVRLVCWNADDPERKRQFLMCNGAYPLVWTGGYGEHVRLMPVLEQSEPLAEGLLYSPFDVMMPFLYWPQWSYEGVKRVGGRATDMFFFEAPEPWRPAYGGGKGVRAALDRTFNALILAQLLDEKGAPARSFRIVDLKKVDDVWIVKTVDCFDEKTRDKDRFTVRAAAVNLELPPDFFSLDAFETPPALPPAYSWRAF